MKIYIIFFYILFCAFPNLAQQDISFPKDNPVFSIYVPDHWMSKYFEDDHILEMYPEDESVFYSVYEFQTKNLDEAVEEAVKILKMEFNEVYIGKPKEDEIDGIKFYIYSGLELNFSNDYEQFRIRLFRINDSNFYMTYLFGIPEDVEYYEWNIGEIDYSIQVAK